MLTKMAAATVVGRAAARLAGRFFSKPQ